jgi:hypothetical protein
VSESREPLQVSLFFPFYRDESTTAVMITKAIRFLSSPATSTRSSLSTAGRPTGPGRLPTSTRIFVSCVYNMLPRFAFRPRFRDVSSAVWRRTVAVLVAGLLGCIAALDSSEAALASAPFAVSLEVSPGVSGNSITVRIELQPTRALDAMEPFDLYVMQLQGFQHAVFMTASGSWSLSPASLRQGLSARGFAPVTVRWSESQLGSIQLLVVAARASSDPDVQANWLFRPVLRGAAVRRRLADAPDRRQATWVLVGLGGLSLMAIGVVLYLPRRRRVSIS